MIIGLAPDENADIDDIFGRVLISRDPLQPMYHIVIGNLNFLITAQFVCLTTLANLSILICFKVSL